ncbi:MAG: DUF1801 domain-containing protein [Gemmatimonadota bacterium]
MAEPKTRPTSASVDAFLDAIADPQRRSDAHTIRRMFETITAAHARMWGETMVGCGTYTRRYANGSTEEWMLLAVAPRADRITLYVAPGAEGHDALLARLGKFKAGKGCVHIKRLADVHQPVLEELLTNSVAHLRQQYG